MSLEMMIQRAVLGDQAGSPDPSLTKTAAATRLQADQPDEIEKLATALEYIGRKGVVNMVKEASEAPPPGTNIGQHHPDHAQRQVGHHKSAPPMNVKSHGEADHNLNSRPGPSEDQAHLSGDGQTSHSALTNSSSAIGFTKKDKARQVAGDLDALFSARPFADPKMAENLNAAGKVDKNIKVKTAADRELLRRAIANKLAQQEG